MIFLISDLFYKQLGKPKHFRSTESARKSPLDSESENAESCDTEVYAVELSDSSGITDENLDEEVVNDPSKPGLSTQAHVPKWTHKRVQKMFPDFTSRSGLSDEFWDLSEKTPLAVFLATFSDEAVELMELIVFEINLYATQSSKSFSSFTLMDFVYIFGNKSSYGHKEDAQLSRLLGNEGALHDDFVSSLMLFRRFSWKLGHLHLNNKLMNQKMG